MGTIEDRKWTSLLEVVPVFSQVTAVMPFVSWTVAWRNHWGQLAASRTA